jgi:predicted AAA+ superfamily ATPase
MKIDDLSQSNPWWENVQLIFKDRDLLRKQKSLVEWVPRLIHYFKFEQDAIYTIRGPRQVGKTTLVKLMIRSLLEKNIHPKRILFYACDLIDGPKELVNLLECYLDNAREEIEERLFVFLDEISSVRDWQRGIKYLVDAGLLQNCTVILTGSHSLDIKNASERLPGRRGDVNEVLDKILLPMKFSEYAEMRSKTFSQAIRFMNLLHKVQRHGVLEQLAQGKIPAEIEKLSPYSKELLRLFQDYLITGGIPPAINSYLEQQEISSNIYETYVSVMLGDAAQWGKKETYMVQIVRRIIECLSSQTSWHSLCEETDLASHQKAAEYVEALGHSYVVSTIYRLDRGKGGPRFEKDKKIHFEDPFIFHAMRGWASSIPSYIGSLEFIGNPETCSKLVESVVCNHLIRLAFNLSPSSDYEYANKVFYWQGKAHGEVDFVVKMDGKYLPVEVKYQSDLRKDDLQGLHEFAQGGKSYPGIIVTKDTLEIKEDITLVPCHLLLALI